MSERASTKGPWRIAGKGTIRTETAWIASVNWRNREANAALIAAAPDLLDACKRASEILRGRGYPSWGIAKDILNEAIAKAEGLGQRADADPKNPLSEGRERS